MTPADHSKPVLSAEDVRQIRILWSLHDNARDDGHDATARVILARIEAKALALGLPSVWALSNL